MPKTKPEPVVIHKIGVSGRVKDTHMGVIIRGETKILHGIETLDQVLTLIKNNQVENYLKDYPHG